MAAPTPVLEIPVETARQAAAVLGQALMLQAMQWQPAAAAQGKPVTRKTWVANAGTWCYHTVVGLTPDRSDALMTSVDTFYRAASLPGQPWYAQFRHGQVQALDAPPKGVMRQQLALSVFDVGLGKPRAYRQLVSVISHASEPVRAVLLRSVDASSLPWPADAVPAFMLDPSGDVFEYRDNTLFWHHICTTPGAGLLPMPYDRWLMNALRAVWLDFAERKTYREEATAWVRWVRGGFNG